MNRRDFLKHGLSVSAGVALSGLPRFSPFARANDAKWRTFEVTTRIEIADPVGAGRAWVPVPLMNNTDYFKREPDSWSGNYKSVREVQTDNVGDGIGICRMGSWREESSLEVKSRFMTQDRWVDLSQKPNPAIKENKAALDYFRKPTKYIRTDGIVATTSKGIVTGYKNDLDKAQAIYDWIVDNTFRDPKVKGCGIGDITTMLESGYLGGKCADLNALYVGLARAAGLPARDCLRCPYSDFRRVQKLR
jgi:transglutaminase-like putative cysteine protease